MNSDFFFDDCDFPASFTDADRDLFARWFASRYSVVMTTTGEKPLHDAANAASAYVPLGTRARDTVHTNGFQSFAIRQFEQNREAIVQALADRDAERLRGERETVGDAEQASSRRVSLADALVEQLARRAGFDGADALRDADAVAHERIVATVGGYKWGSTPLLDQEVGDEEIPARAGAIWKNVVSRFMVPRATNLPAESLVHDAAARELTEPDGDIEARVEALLRANVLESFTYNQVATSLGVDYKAASRALRALVKRPCGGVIEFESNASGKPVRLFKHAPWRKRIDADPSQTDAVVNRSMLGLIAKRPALSVRKIRDAMRQAFGHLANDIIDRALKTAVASGSVVTKPGPRGASLHYIAGAEIVAAEPEI